MKFQSRGVYTSRLFYALGMVQCLWGSGLLLLLYCSMLRAFIEMN